MRRFWLLGLALLVAAPGVLQAQFVADRYRLTEAEQIELAQIEPNMMLGLELMKTDRYAKNGIGWIEEKKMCASVDLVNTYMGLPSKVDCKAVFSTAFLPKIELPATMR